MIPSKYLKASDAEDSPVLTISHVKEESIGQGAQADMKWILFFEEEEKGLVLNRTNINTIAGMYGDDTDDWEGKKITLFATQVDFQGKQVDAIRVRNRPPKTKEAKPAKPAATAPAAEIDPDSEEAPF